MRLPSNMVWALLWIGVIAVFGTAEAKRVPMYATYHPGYIDYFYTIDPSQRDLALQAGYFNGGIGFYVEDDPTFPSAYPFRRFWKGYPQYDHFYTINSSEANYVLSLGWVEEQVEGYLTNTQPYGSQVLYRVSKWNENTGDLVHFYTLSQSQANYMVWFDGWTMDGGVGFAYPHGGLLDNAQIPVLIYHTGHFAGPNCDSYEGNDLVALQSDLQTLYDDGYRIVPLRAAMEWALGQRTGDTLPQKAVAITFDDGFLHDWNSYTGHPACPNVVLPSARSVLSNFLASHPDAVPSGHTAPYYVATSFVIASRRARSPDTLWPQQDDSWWHDALVDPNALIDIQNHSTDHDDASLGYSCSSPMYDTNMGINLAVGGEYDGKWKGGRGFSIIGLDSPSWTTADHEVKKAAEEIYRITNVRGVPDMFATPTGNMSAGLKNYLETRGQSDHHTWVAFGPSGDYVRRDVGQSPYNFRRFIKACNWNSPSELLDILHGVRTAKNQDSCVPAVPPYPC